MWEEEKKRKPIRASVKNEVYERAKGYCENPNCKMKNVKMTKRRGRFHHTRAPHINPTAQTVQFLCPACHEWYGHEIKTKTESGLFVDRKVVTVKRKRVGSSSRSKKSSKNKTTRTRRYSCELSVGGRSLLCGKRQASSACLKAGLLGGRCSNLKISYK